MRRTRLQTALSAGAVVVAALLASASVMALPDSGSPAVPHAHAKPSGRGWECNRGYREVDTACVAIEVPANAYLEPSGNGWTCDRGYRATGQSCAQIDVPPNAYAVSNSYGHGWECERGYRDVNEACVAVLKSFTRSAWHSAQLCEPANSAPGICGGAIIVRWVVEQEITATPASKPAPTNTPHRRSRRARDLERSVADWLGWLAGAFMC